jgi:hypothetical protein
VSSYRSDDALRTNLCLGLGDGEADQANPLDACVCMNITNRRVLIILLFIQFINKLQAFDSYSSGLEVKRREFFVLSVKKSKIEGSVR